MTVSLTAAVLNTGLAGLVLSFLLLAGYYFKVRSMAESADISADMEQYYRFLQPAVVGSLFSFAGLFVFLWYVHVVGVAHDWVRLSLDVLQIVFIGLATVVGRKLVKEMIRIQKEYGV